MEKRKAQVLGELDVEELEKFLKDKINSAGGNEILGFFFSPN